MPATGKRDTKRRPAPGPSEHDDSAAVTELLRSWKHPLRPVAEAIRRAILEADPSVTEGIKWNSPSFYRNGWFATLNLRGKDGVLVVLHRGAKAREEGGRAGPVDDPAGLLTWPGTDRAVVRFSSEEEFGKKRAAFQKVVRQWADQQ